jgi:hypothetical protein
MSGKQKVSSPNSQSSIAPVSPIAQKETTLNTSLREPQPVPPKFVIIEKGDVVTQNEQTFGVSKEKVNG